MSHENFAIVYGTLGHLVDTNRLHSVYISVLYFGVERH